MKAVLGVLLLAFLAPVYAAGSTYPIDVDGHEYDIEYSADADVIAMAIDQESRSLLIGLENARDSVFEITLPDEMISAEGDEFVVLVDWAEADFEAAGSGEEPLTTVRFAVPEGAVEVEIVGTMVVPEFSAGLALALSATLAGAVALSRRGLGRNLV